METLRGCCTSLQACAGYFEYVAQGGQGSGALYGNRGQAWLQAPPWPLAGCSLRTPHSECLLISAALVQLCEVQVPPPAHQRPGLLLRVALPGCSLLCLFTPSALLRARG